jgi:hypothetical protein
VRTRETSFFLGSQPWCCKIVTEMADTDFTSDESLQEELEEIGKWLLRPYPGEEDIIVDHYDLGDMAVYGIWNLNSDKRYAVNPDDHVRIRVSPYDRTMLEISILPKDWPTRAGLVSPEKWIDISNGQDYDQSDEVLYDLAPSTVIIDIGDLDMKL